jgi:hypothetical protein
MSDELDRRDREARAELEQMAQELERRDREARAELERMAQELAARTAKKAQAPKSARKKVG